MVRVGKHLVRDIHYGLRALVHKWCKTKTDLSNKRITTAKVASQNRYLSERGCCALQNRSVTIFVASATQVTKIIL